jgi:NAD(P)-dependent dehydrogenase (short-subunit alcohol dehydrogenase family)
MGRLQDKVALITGATGGIGLATAKLFAAEGAKLVLLDLDQSALDQAVADIGTDNALGIATNVVDAEAMAASVAAGVARFGTLDAAFLNAGIEGAVARIVDYSLEDFDKVMAVNVRGVFVGLKYVIPEMKKAGRGSIILTSSLAGLRGMGKISAYVASKHAVVGLMKAAALECASFNVRVNTINPAPIATRMIDSLEQGFGGGDATQMKDRIEQGIPMRRYGQPEEVAELALFLASDNAGFITGNSYPIDGGMLAA